MMVAGNLITGVTNNLLYITRALCDFLLYISINSIYVITTENHELLNNAMERYLAGCKIIKQLYIKTAM